MTRLICSLLLALAFAGCATMTAGGRGDAVEEVHLFGLPATLNLDNKPGADGFGVRVFIAKSGSVKGAALQSGSLEILMFDGVLGAAEAAKQTPQQVWKFTAHELEPYRDQSSLGVGYQLTLRWNEAPKLQHITAVARYVPPKGAPVYSAPSAISSAAAK